MNLNILTSNNKEVEWRKTISYNSHTKTTSSKFRMKSWRQEAKSDSYRSPISSQHTATRIKQERRSQVWRRSSLGAMKDLMPETSSKTEPIKLDTRSKRLKVSTQQKSMTTLESQSTRLIRKCIFSTMKTLACRRKWRWWFTNGQLKVKMKSSNKAHTKHCSAMKKRIGSRMSWSKWRQQDSLATSQFLTSLSDQATS